MLRHTLAAVALAFLWAVSVIGNSGDPEEWWALVDGSGAARQQRSSQQPRSQHNQRRATSDQHAGLLGR